MKWVVIDNTGHSEELVLYKTYDGISSDFVDPFCILINNEFGIVTEYYQPLRFVSIEEWRDMQINKIVK